MSMTSRAHRMLFLAWLCCYLAGPLVEMIDFWDKAEQEMVDLASSSTGMLIWVAAAVAVGISLFRQFWNACRHLKRVREVLMPLLLNSLPIEFAVLETTYRFASPPLRI